MTSYAKQNIIKYQNRQRNELLKVAGYHFLEVLTAISIFVFAYLYFKYL